jgi:hypothetical protein
VNALSNLELNGSTFTENGTYFQTLKNEYGCDSLITIHLKIVTNDHALLISPNPTSDNITVSIPKDFVGNAYKIYDYTGRILRFGNLTAENQNLSISNFACGIYFLSVEGLPKIATIVKE